MSNIDYIPIYNPFLVLLSVGIAFIGAYITICLAEQLRLKKLPDPLPSALLGEKGMIVTMAVSLGGIAIWSMHFVGMSSMKLRNPLTNEIVATRYNAWQTAVSLIAVVVMAMIGLYIGSLDNMFGKSKKEIVEVYVNHASKMTMAEVKKISPLKMIWIISTHSLGNLVCGGVIAGSGVSVMHYLGMWALEFEEGKIVWNAGVITASILIAVVAATAGFWILFRLLSLYSHLEYLRLLSAAVMTVAVCGMHYTGMMAATFRREPSAKFVAGVTASDAAFFIGTENVALILSYVLLIVVIIEIRSQHYKQAVELMKKSGGASSRAASQHASRIMSENAGKDSHSGQRSPEKVSYVKHLLKLPEIFYNKTAPTETEPVTGMSRTVAGKLESGEHCVSVAEGKTIDSRTYLHA